MSKKVYIAANWKMNKGISESIEFQRIFTKIIGSDKEIREIIRKNIEILVFPPIVSLNLLKNMENEDPISFGVQNIHWKESGAFTGENSILMSLEAGADFALVGHSERRHIFGENNEIVRKKFESCEKKGLRPVLCVGETDPERKNGSACSVIKNQVEEALSSFDGNLPIKPLFIAYEPVWAIGTGNNATGSDAQESCSVIRACVKNTFDEATAKETVILYGGSVNALNSIDFLLQDDIDGLLVGGASLDPEQFYEIVKAAASVSK